MSVTCAFRNLVGVVVMPDRQRIEIVETDQQFAGDTGLPATGVGRAIAALTEDGLVFGDHCRPRRAQRQTEAARDLVGPWPETVPTWLRCGMYGDVPVDATAFRGGYRLSISGSVRASLLPSRDGGISFSHANCRRFIVTGNQIP